MTQAAATVLVATAGTLTVGANTPSFTVPIVYPVTATAKSASALTMSLAAATVMATLF